MQKTISKKVIQFLSIFLVCLVVTIVVYFWSNGLPLFGLPDPTEITSVTVLDTRLSDTERQITDTHKILTARNAANLLRYKWGDTTGLEEPFITITYHLVNGKEMVVQASDEMVIWKGKAHPLLGEPMFARVVEVFFFEDLLQE